MSVRLNLAKTQLSSKIDGGYVDSLNSLSYLYSSIYLKNIPYISSKKEKVFPHLDMREIKKNALEHASLAISILGEETKNHRVIDSLAVAKCINDKFDDAITLEERAYRLSPHDEDYAQNLSSFKMHTCTAYWLYGLP